MRLAPGLVRMLDVAFVSGQRLPRRRVPREPIAELVPDLALEILSKGDTRREMARKLAEYFTSGVRLAWLVEPTKRTVRVYTSSQSSHLVRESGKLDGGDVPPVFRLLFATGSDERNPARNRKTANPKNNVSGLGLKCLRDHCSTRSASACGA